jgi:hypothetical protein
MVDMGTHEALTKAVLILGIAAPHAAKPEAVRDIADVLQMIIDQQGCEHLDGGTITDGRLTTFMDVVIFG